MYIVKIALRGVSPMSWRRLRVPDRTSLATLHDIIQLTFGWDDEYLHQFHIYGKDYGIWYDGGPTFDNNAHEVYLDDFGFDIGDKFTYEYNFFEHHIHDIRIEDIVELPSKQLKPLFCVSGAGMPGFTKYDEYHIQNKLIETIAKIPTVTKTEEQTILDRLRKLFRQLDMVKFNRKKTNSVLVKVKIGV